MPQNAEKTEDFVLTPKNGHRLPQLIHAKYLLVWWIFVQLMYFWSSILYFRGPFEALLMRKLQYSRSRRPLSSVNARKRLKRMESIKFDHVCGVNSFRFDHNCENLMFLAKVTQATLVWHQFVDLLMFWSKSNTLATFSLFLLMFLREIVAAPLSINNSSRWLTQFITREHCINLLHRNKLAWPAYKTRFSYIFVFSNPFSVLFSALLSGVFVQTLQSRWYLNKQKNCTH